MSQERLTMFLSWTVPLNLKSYKVASRHSNVTLNRLSSTHDHG